MNAATSVQKLTALYNSKREKEKKKRKKEEEKVTCSRNTYMTTNNIYTQDFLFIFYMCRIRSGNIQTTK